MDTQRTLQRVSAKRNAVLSVVFIWRQVAALAIKKVQFQQTFSSIVATCVNYDFITEDATVRSSYEYNKRWQQWQH